MDYTQSFISAFQIVAMQHLKSERLYILICCYDRTNGIFKSGYMIFLFLNFFVHFNYTQKFAVLFRQLLQWEWSC
jgi:hypothetical protein